MRGLTIFLAVLGAYIALTAALLWPWLTQFHHALIGPPEDNMNDFWNTWYASVGANPAHFFFTTLLRFPEGTPLTYQSFAYPQVFAVALLSKALGSDGHTLATLQNLTVLASFPLAGLGAFYLVRHLTHSTVGGLIGGFTFAFSPFHIAQAGHHAGVASIEFLPFFVLAYLLAVKRRSASCFAATVILYALSALSCWYYLFYGAYFLAFELLHHRVRQHAWPQGWDLLAAPLCIACTLAVLSPALLPMIVAARPSVYIGGGNTFVADLLGYFTFPPQHPLSFLSDHLYHRFTGNPWEATVYLGLVNLGILLWHWFRTGITREPLNLYSGLGMLTFGILACGEALHIGGSVTFLHLPDVVLDKLPFFANVRAPSRAVVFVYLFMSIGIGAAAAAIWQRHGVISRSVLAAVAVLIVLDFCPLNLQATPVDRSPGLSLLRVDMEQGFGVLNLPFGYVEENDYMLEQAYHGRPMVDGNTAREMTTSLLNRLSLVNLGRQREQLAHAHVKYILLHRPSKGWRAWSASLAPLAEFLRTYRGVYQDWGLIVLRVY